jgi:hypothetical protein
MSTVILRNIKVLEDVDCMGKRGFIMGWILVQSAGDVFPCFDSRSFHCLVLLPLLKMAIRGHFCVKNRAILEPIWAQNNFFEKFSRITF